MCSFFKIILEYGTVEWFFSSLTASMKYTFFFYERSLVWVSSSKDRLQKRESEGLTLMVSLRMATSRVKWSFSSWRPSICALISGLVSLACWRVLTTSSSNCRTNMACFCKVKRIHEKITKCLEYREYIMKIPASDSICTLTPLSTLKFYFIFHWIFSLKTSLTSEMSKKFLCCYWNLKETLKTTFLQWLRRLRRKSEDQKVFAEVAKETSCQVA